MGIESKLAVDADACVLRDDGMSIANLLATDETTADVTREYCEGGNSISNALAFGWRAGTGAARPRQAAVQ